VEPLEEALKPCPHWWLYPLLEEFLTLMDCRICFDHLVLYYYHEIVRPKLGSMNWMIPTPQAFGDMEIVITPTVKFSANEYPVLFAYLNDTTTSQMAADIDPFRNFSAPGVPVNCIRGTAMFGAVNL
jgi:hypothetical protein